ncbi:MAG TPA: TetR/AcrR family transcriptional regulator [Stellaceae bacterium]|jgi:AcrR family transcriptional regulator
MPRNAADTRTRIIDAAEDLFYAEGFRAVSVDAIAERAGVTKRTLYYHFASKNELMAAYLDGRDASTMTRYQEWFAKTGEGLPISERIAGIFAKFAEWSSNPEWKGCGFIRAASELAGEPDHPAVAVASRHKKGFEAWLAGLIAEAGIADSALAARRIMLLLDGAASQSLLHRDPSYAEAAIGAVHALLAPGPIAATASTSASAMIRPSSAEPLHSPH